MLMSLDLTLENTVIKQVTETKFLGILIDQHLSWNPHIDFASKKILKSVGIIAKAHFYLSSQTLMTLYYSLVYPFLAYCSNLNCINFCKSIYSSAVHNKSSLSSLKVLDIFRIISFSVATFMYSYHHNLLPSSFRELLLNSNQVHQYET